ncbi:MAG: hypothetical protein E6G82_16605 [Alphaproteobacteria bacterium]|nr:MAG: hypothetical protein E6G82_16605 [Alphaproteobacteria bacterium]
MTQPQPHVPAAREQKFLESVEEGRYEREIISGLGPFFHEKAPEDMLNFYSKDEVTRLKVLKGTERDVESRMPVKITRHYYELARTSAAIQRIVKADPAETMDLAGSEDPGHQMDYSPVEGLLHTSPTSSSTTRPWRRTAACTPKADARSCARSCFRAATRWC